MENQLYSLIKSLSPGLDKSSLYTQDDLISEVYLLAHEKGLTQENIPELKKLIREASYRRYRPKYKAHSTSHFRAEELLEYCSNRIVLSSEEEPQVTIWDYLRAALETD